MSENWEGTPKMMDWNELTLEEMANHLRQEFFVSSSGTAKCIFHLLEFYDKHKAVENKCNFFFSSNTALNCDHCGEHQSKH